MTKKLLFRRAIVIMVFALVAAACSSPSYGDLNVGDCVSGLPQIEDQYDRIPCNEAAGTGEVYYKVVNKAPESDAAFGCSPFSLWISDGDWQICFEPAG